MLVLSFVLSKNGMSGEAYISKDQFLLLSSVISPSFFFLSFETPDFFVAEESFNDEGLICPSTEVPGCSFAVDTPTSWIFINESVASPRWIFVELLATKIVLSF